MRLTRKVIFLSLLVAMSITLFVAAPKAHAQERVMHTSNLLPNPTITLSFQPKIADVLLPVKFSLDSNGNFSVGPSDWSIDTPLGLVTLSSQLSIPLLPQLSSLAQQTPMAGNSLLLIVRHQQGPSLVDDNILIQAKQTIQGVDIKGSISEVSIKWTGVHFMVFVDASHGDITDMALQGVSTSTALAPKSGCPSAAMVAWSMNLDVNSVQQIDGPCAFQWNNPGTGNQINTLCAVGYGPNAVVLTFTDWFHSLFDQGATTSCDGHNTASIDNDISDAASATITF